MWRREFVLSFAPLGLVLSRRSRPPDAPALPRGPLPLGPRGPGAPAARSGSFLKTAGVAGMNELGRYLIISITPRRVQLDHSLSTDGGCWRLQPTRTTIGCPCCARAPGLLWVSPSHSRCPSVSGHETSGLPPEPPDLVAIHICPAETTALIIRPRSTR